MPGRLSVLGRSVGKLCSLFLRLRFLDRRYGRPRIPAQVMRVEDRGDLFQAAAGDWRDLRCRRPRRGQTGSSRAVQVVKGRSLQRPLCRPFPRDNRARVERPDGNPPGQRQRGHRTTRRRHRRGSEGQDAALKSGNRLPWKSEVQIFRLGILASTGFGSGSAFSKST